MQPDDRFIRIKEVRHLTGLSRSTIYRLAQDGKFPQRINLGGNTVVWIESEVQGWLDSRASAQKRTPWTPPNPPPRKVRDSDELPPLAPPEKGAEAAAKIAGVVGIKTAGDEIIPNDEIALRFPDWPEMMRRRTAAAYLDLTESAFVREVGRGVLPFPILLGGREAWSRQQIDRAIAKLLARQTQIFDHV